MNKSSRSAWNRSIVGVVTVLGSSFAPRLASAETIDTTIGEGIGTVVADAFGDGSNVAINTSISSVRYQDPVHVSRNGLSYLEVSGSIQGTGWGGVAQELGQWPPAPPVDAFSHYSYDIPFVLRFRHNFDGTLVAYNHGFGSLDDNVFFEEALGPNNDSRRCELEGTFLSDAALASGRGHGFFAPNLCGLGHDGQFTVFATEGPFEGQPLSPGIDVPITRDMTQLAGRLLAQLSGRAVERTFGSGHSGGAATMQFIGGGVSTALFGPAIRVFTGGNFVNAYDPTSGVVFDGLFPIGGGDAFVNVEFPLSAPLIMIGGTADYAAVDNVIYADRLLRNGVDLDANVRIYHVANMPHSFGELIESAPNIMRFILEEFGERVGRDTDRMAPVAAAALDNLYDWVARGRPPPPSRIAGEPVDTDADGVVDAIRFPQVGGTTSLFPYVDDPALDVTFADQFELSVAAGFGLTVARYVEVLEALDHSSEALLLPYQTCRLGGYELANTGTLVPFPDLSSHWKNFGRYNSCLQHAVNDLGHTGLYDKKIGKDVVVQDFILALFD